MNNLSQIKDAVANFVEEILPFLHYVRRKKCAMLRAKCKRILEKHQFAQYASISTDDLLKRLCEERQRATAIDEKTFKMTFSISVGLTILGSTSAFLVDQILLPQVRIAFISLIVLGLFYVIASGFIALGALKTLPSYGYGTNILLIKPEKLQQVLAESLARAESINLVRHLRNETAYQSLRNGFILLFSAATTFTLFIGIQTFSPEFLSTGISESSSGI